MSGLRSTTQYTYNNNHSNEFGRNYFSVCKYIALKCIVKYIILITKFIMHTHCHTVTEGRPQDLAGGGGVARIFFSNLEI